MSKKIRTVKINLSRTWRRGEFEVRHRMGNKLYTVLLDSGAEISVASPTLMDESLRLLDDEVRLEGIIPNAQTLIRTRIRIPLRF